MSVPAFCPWPLLGSPRDLLLRFGRPARPRLFTYRGPPSLPPTSRFRVILRFGARQEPPADARAVRVLLPFHQTAIHTDDSGSGRWT